MRVQAIARAAIPLLVLGCAVPRRAGFDDVSRRLAGRTPYRVHWNQGTREDAEIAAETRRLLGGELTVETATQVALFNNPELQATYERLGVAQADVVQAGLLRNPRLSFHWGFRILEEGLDEIVGSLTGAFLDLFLMPLRKKLARAEFERVKLEVADAVLAKVDAVAQAFYTAQASTEVVAMRRTMLVAEQAAAELATRQHEAGNLSDLDLAAEEAAWTQAKLELARAEYRLVADRERLSRLLGVFGHDTDYKLAAKLPALPPVEPDAAALERIALAQRFDLQAAREAVRSVARAITLAKARIFGAVDLGVQGHRDPDGPATIGPTVELELPIFDQKQAELARLGAELRAAQARADTLALDIRSDVRLARSRVTLARTTIEHYAHGLVPLRERIVALSQAHYNAMLLGVYQLLQAKEQEIATYSEYIEAVRDYFIARADLERAIGTRLDGGRR